MKSMRPSRPVMPALRLYQRSTSHNAIRSRAHLLAGHEPSARYKAAGSLGRYQGTESGVAVMDFRCAYRRTQGHLQGREGRCGLMPSESKPYLNPRAQAEALAAALRDKNIRVLVLASRGHERHPCVHVTSPLPVDIYAAPEAGKWYFWWSWMECIGPIDAIAEVAEVIAYVL